MQQCTLAQVFSFVETSIVSSVDRAKRAGGGVGNKRKVGGRGNRGWFHRGERERVSIFEDQFYFNPIERR